MKTAAWSVALAFFTVSLLSPVHDASNGTAHAEGTDADKDVLIGSCTWSKLPHIIDILRANRFDFTWGGSRGSGIRVARSETAKAIALLKRDAVPQGYLTGLKGVQIPHASHRRRSQGSSDVVIGTCRASSMDRVASILQSHHITILMFSEDLGVADIVVAQSDAAKAVAILRNSRPRLSSDVH